MPNTAFEYDVFISHAENDKLWVEQELLPRLNSENIKPSVGFIDFLPGAPEISEIERCIYSSRKTLLIISPNYLKYNLADFENQLTRFLDPSAKERRCIPVKITSCDIPTPIKYLVYIDLTSENKSDLIRQWDRLIKNLKNAEDGKARKSKKRKKTKSPPLPLIERELRMNELHWINAGISVPARDFNFTLVYFDNQMEIFQKLRAQLDEVRKKIQKKQASPSNSAFLKDAYAILEQIHLRATQIQDILDADNEHALSLTTQKVIDRLLENSNKARKSLMRRSTAGVVQPRELKLIDMQLPIELHAIGISIEELQKYLRQIYSLTDVALSS